MRIRARLPQLHPPPAGALPVLVGGSGEKVTRRLVAQYADAWNFVGPLDGFKRKSDVLDGWCARVGRNPASIERTVSVFAEDPLFPLKVYESAGVDHVIRSVRYPFNLDDVVDLLAQRG